MHPKIAVVITTAGSKEYIDISIFITIFITFIIGKLTKNLQYLCFTECFTARTLWEHFFVNYPLPTLFPELL